MKTFTFDVRTDKHTQMKDITMQVQDAVRQSGALFQRLEPPLSTNLWSEKPYSGFYNTVFLPLFFVAHLHISPFI